MIKSPKSSRDCFRNHAIAADRVVDRRLRDRLSSGAFFFVDLIFAHGVFLRFVSVTPAILRGSGSMATTAAVHLSVFTEKLRLEMRMAWPMCLINTSMVTYITSYKAINTKLIGWVPSPSARRGFCWFLSLEP